MILPIYNLLHITKKKGLEDVEISHNKLTALFTNKYFIHAILILLFLGIIINNFHIQNVSAEELGKKSLFYELVQGDEFEQDIIEEIDFNLEAKEGYNKLDQQEELNFDFLEPESAVLTRYETVDKELNESNLQDTNVAEGLTADTLLKTGSPTTFTTPQPREQIQEYVVQSGDTISSIAKKFNISINTLLWANDLSGLSIIRPGDKLTVLPVSGVLHKVVKNDTISGIAKKYGVEQNEILSFNSLVNDSQLSIGQFIIIPGGEIEQTYQNTTGGFASVFKSPSSEKKSGGFIWPTVGRHITQYYNWRHHAIDIGGSTSSPIYASMAGKIIKAGWTTGYGYNVIIDHGGGKRTLYAHLSKIYVQNGDQVTQGTVVGALGSTGWSTGPHLHFEIILNGTKVNPLSYL